MSTDSIVLAQGTNRCDPVGVFSSEAESGRIVCAGEQISINGRAQLHCFSNEAVIDFSQSQIMIGLNLCNNNPTSHRCGPGGRCFNPRTPETPGNRDSFEIITPDPITADLRPVITWEPVPDATSYTVKITGDQINWQVDVTEPKLEFPVDQKPLEPGQAYEVIIIARAAGVLATARGAVNIVDPIANFQLRQKRSSSRDG